MPAILRQLCSLKSWASTCVRRACRIGLGGMQKENIGAGMKVAGNVRVTFMPTFALIIPACTHLPTGASIVEPLVDARFTSDRVTSVVVDGELMLRFCSTNALSCRSQGNTCLSCVNTDALRPVIAAMLRV